MAEKNRQARAEELRPTKLKEGDPPKEPDPVYDKPYDDPADLASAAPAEDAPPAAEPTPAEMDGAAQAEEAKA